MNGSGNTEALVFIIPAVIYTSILIYISGYLKKITLSPQLRQKTFLPFQLS
jgi:ABC-type cobalt transport system substrate-binding protein